MNTVELSSLVGGAVSEQFKKAFDKVVENLQNPNTSFKVARGITIQMKFTQNEQRDDVKCSISVSEKLAPQSSMQTQFYVEKDLETGEVHASEYGRQIRGQMSINDYPVTEPVQQVEEKVVNTETGEIVSDHVIDFRKANNM